MGRAFILASPFLIGVIWSFISPFLVRGLAKTFEGKLNKELADAGYVEASQAQESADAAKDVCRPAIPLPIRPANLRTYVDWLIDAPQLLPTILLGAVGVIVTIAEARHLLLTYVICAVATLAGIFATAWIMKKNPQEYSAAFRIKIFTTGAFIGFVINFVAAVIIVVGVSV